MQEGVRFRLAKILVADDDESVRIGLAANLELEGYQVTEACDGGEALALIEKTEFDLVVSDVVMPVANGVEVLRGLKRLRPDTPLILISAFISESLVSAAVAEGLYTMLYKPVGMEDVLRVVERALARKWLLLVDDARPYASGLAASLKSVGMNVETVFDAEGAIAFAKQNAIDVCVLDLLMAPTDGFAALEALRAIDRNLDVVAITGSNDPEVLQRIARLGVSSCLRKPFPMKDLLGSIVKVRGAAKDRRS
jgi:DNA-binding NtrC family response regulator